MKRITTFKPIVLYTLIVFQILLFTILTHAQLTIEWDKTFGGTGYEELNDMIPCTDGGYLLIGRSNSPVSGEVSQPNRGGEDFWVVKTDENGNKLWDRRYGGSSLENCFSGFQTADGGYILGGFSNSPADPTTEKTDYNRGGIDYWAVKIRGDGSVQWDKAFGGDANDFLFAIAETPTGGYLFAGCSYSDANFDKSENSRGGADFWVIKTDNAGNKVWDKTYGGDADDWLFSMKPLPGGGYILGGMSFSDANGEKTDPLRGQNDYWLIKIDEDGNQLWDKTYGGDQEETLASVLPTDDGGYLLFGKSASDGTGDKTSPYYGSADAWLLKVNDTGDIMWQQSYGGDQPDLAYAGQVNSTGNIIITGVSYSGQTGNKSEPNLGENDFWIIYTDASGNKLWDKTYGGTDIDSPPRIYFANGGGYIIGGHSSSNHNQYKSEDSRGLNDFWMVKTYCPLVPINIRDTAVCEGTAMEYDIRQPNCPGCTYNWNDGGYEGIRTFIANTDQDMNVTTVHPDGCSIADTFSLFVAENPEITDFKTVDIACYGDHNGMLHIEKADRGLPPYEYALDDSPFSPDKLFRNLDGGEYSLNVRDARGCIGTQKAEINEPNEFIVKIGKPDYLVRLGDSVLLNITSTEPIDTFVWDAPELLSCNDCLTPYIKPTESRHYRLSAISNNGCKATDWTYIEIEKKRPVYVPNIFSPNNDGENDYFMIRGNNSLQLIISMEIYNRWGNLVFARKNIPPHGAETDGWDGTFKGTRLRTGVYTYKIEALFTDGTLEIISGGVTLVR